MNFEDEYDVFTLGLEPERSALLDRAGELGRATNRGGTIILVGDEGSGQRHLLERFAADAKQLRPRPLVSYGAFESGTYAARDLGGLGIAKAWQLVEATASIVGPFHPVLALAAQLVSQSDGARRLLQALAWRGERRHPLALIPDVMSQAARDLPVICVVEDADKSGYGWWTDLFLTFSRQIATDVPVLLVLTMNGPQSVAGYCGDTPELIIARELVAAGLAAWRPLPRATVDGITRWLGPADRRVARLIEEVTGGRIGWTVDMWRERREDGTVAREAPGRRWALAATGLDDALPSGLQRLSSRLRQVVGHDVTRLAKAQRILACGALEGRLFTAEAVALALKEQPDDVAAFIHGHLAVNGPEMRAIVQNVDEGEVADEAGVRRISRYRFRSEIDWLVLRRYGIGDGEHGRETSAALARGLIATYGREADRVAREIAALSEFAGETELAREYKHLRNVVADRETMMWRAKRALHLSGTATQWERDRDAEALLGGASAVYDSGPWQLGERFAATAAAVTSLASLRAMGTYYKAWFDWHLGDAEEARRGLQLALEGFRQVHDADGVADALHQLANLDYAAHRYDEAEAGYREVARMRAARNNHVLEARAYEALGDISVAKDDLDTARIEYTRAVEIELSVGAAGSYANTLMRLASLDADTGEVDVAHDRFIEALRIQREYGDRRDEASTLRRLADLEYERGRYEQALTAICAALAIERELGGVRYEPAIQQTLGNCLWALRRGAEARDVYFRALRGYENDGDLAGAHSVHWAIADLAYESEHWAEAARHFGRLLAVRHDSLERSDEAAVRHKMADALYRAGHRLQAREAWAHAVNLEQERNMRDDEAVSHMGLGEIAFDEGDYRVAYTHFAQALRIDQALGNRDREAVDATFLGLMALRTGDRAAARSRLARALELYRELGDFESEETALKLLTQAQER